MYIQLGRASFINRNESEWANIHKRTAFSFIIYHINIVLCMCNFYILFMSISSL